MPKRPRSHQIEDLSKIAFRKAIPSNWVVRSKEHDYGVDEEIEIFDDENSSTGLIFFAQLRATDSTLNALKFKITLEQLKYFYSLQLPTLLVRYSAQDDQMFSRWHFNVKPSSKEETQKSMSFDFFQSEKWNESTPHHLKKTVHDIRALRGANEYTVIFLNVENAGVAAGEMFKVHKALEEIVESVSCISFDGTVENSISLTIAVFPTRLKIHAGAIFSTSFEIDQIDAAFIQSAVSYSLAMILGAHSLILQTQQIMSWILNNSIKFHSKELAFQTVCRLGLDPKGAVKIAILNELHEKPDFYCISIVRWLLTLPDHLKSFVNTEIFLSAHLQKMLATNKSDAASGAYYSIANLLSNAGHKKEAFSYFNRAKKLFPEYLMRDYFLNEIGGALFLSRKYRCAVFAYEKALAIKADVKVKFNLADALTFCGRVVEAQNYFLECRAMGTALADHELELKIFICGQLIELYGVQNLLVKSTVANQQFCKWIGREADATVDDWAKIILIDAFHEVANYNWASFQFESQNFGNALLGYLICCFRQPNDQFAWTNAMSSAMSLERLDLMACIVATSTRLCGRQPYDEFRKQLEHLEARSDLIEAWTKCLENSDICRVLLKIPK